MTEGLFATGVEVMTLAAALASAAFTLVVIRPQLGAYLFLLASPLIVGIGRGDLISNLRPNEILMLLIVAALLTRWVLLLLAGCRYHFVATQCDLALVLLATASSVMPLLLRYGRGLPLSTDDLLYSIVLWKYFILYRAFRAAISTTAQVECCLWLSMTSAAVVFVIAILQVGNLFGIPQFLYTYYDQPFSGWNDVVTSRASSTLGSSFGFADLMIMNLLIALALLRYKQEKHWLLLPAAGAFLSGCIASGQVSGFLGMGVALLVFGLISGHLFRVATLCIPAALLASVALWPIIAERLAGFSSAAGIPSSWQGRWANLQHFFFPELFSHFNWLVGVRPAARVPAPETWRDWVFIESGYVWLLWIGGIPMVVAFIYFVWIWARHLWRITRERSDPAGVGAAAGLCYLMVMLTTTLFDPHLTLRGSADLFFPLLALSFVAPRFERNRDCTSLARLCAI